MRCDTCKHWLPPHRNELDPVRKRMGTCGRVALVEDMTKWSDDDRWRVLLSEYSDRTAAVFDASGNSAGLMTAPEHYCAMWTLHDAATGSGDDKASIRAALDVNPDAVVQIAPSAS